MSLINSIFQPVIGKMCWDVKSGVGSSLAFEFGEPHFKVIREPFESKSKKPSMIRLSKRRIVSICGDWHLWIWSCDWRFFRNDTFISDSEASKRELRQIALDLEGQALVNVRVVGAGITVFEFDLGGRLETFPYSDQNEESEPEEQWLLYQPSGMVFIFRSDGKYSYHMGNETTFEEWLPIEDYRNL
jgi:hypothetical protein